MQMALLLLLFMYGKLAEGYSSGAPGTTCNSMTPHHTGSSPMRSAPPFEIIIRPSSMTYSPGQQFQVMVRPKVNGAQFVGYMIEGETRSNQIVGSILQLPFGAKYVQCTSPGVGDKQVITHSSTRARAGREGTPLTFIWQAPPMNAGDVFIRATIVANYNIYWIHVDSQVLRYTAPQPQPAPRPPQQRLPGPAPSQQPTQNKQPTQFVRPNRIEETGQFQPQLPPRILPRDPQQAPQNPQQMVPVLPTQNQNPQQPAPWPNQNPQQLQPLQPLQPTQQLPFQPQALPPLQPAQLPPLQPQPLPPFQPNQPQSPFQNPFQRPPQQQHPHVPMLRTLPAFTPPPKATTKATPSILVKDPECGVTKGCHNMCTGTDCQHTITWKDNVDYVEFELAAKLQAGDQWIAIGFSDDLQMGNDEVIECVSNNGDVNVFHSFNVGKSNRRSSDEKLRLINTEGSFVNGILKCKFRRSKQIGPQGNNELFDLEKDWYLMFGDGPATSGFQMRMHSKNPMVTTNRIDFQALGRPGSGGDQQEQTTPTTTTTTQSPVSVDVGRLAQDKSCGKTKGCYSVDKYSVSWRDTELFTDFEVSARIPNTGNQWTAIAFSEDLKMGDDEVIECVSSDEKVDVFRSFNNGQENTRLTDSKHGLLNTMGSFKDGVFSCGFRRVKNPIRSKRSAGDDDKEEEVKIMDLDKTWHLMVGSGPASTSYEKRMHTSNPKVSPAKVNFQSLDVIGGTAGYPLIKAHACLMIIAWILFTGIGVIAARYFKTVWVRSSLMGQKIWFQIHRSCMVASLVLTLIGFVIIFIEAEGYSQIPKIPGKEYTQAHPVLGIIVTLLCIGNPIMALFRPGPKDSSRPLFNWAHWAVGMLAHVLSVITICFGIEMNKSPTPEYAVWVVVGYVVYHLLMEVLMKTFDVCLDRPDANKNNAYEMKNKAQYGTAENGNGTQPPTYAEVIPKSKRDPKDSIFKKVLFTIHIIFAVAFTVTLVLLFAMY